MRVTADSWKWRLARELGLDMEDMEVLAILGKEAVTMEEGAKVLQNHRSNLYRAMERGSLKVTSTPHGAQLIHLIKVTDLLEFASNRPTRYRLVDPARAARYAAEDRKQ